MRTIFVCLLLFASVAGRAETRREIALEPAPAWVEAPPTAPAGATPPDAAARFVYADTQVRVVPGGTATYSAYRIKLLRPEALAAGNIAVTWEPTGAAAVHVLRIFRDDRVIDVLKTASFRTVEREQNLEASALDGELTSTLQVPGLQVGDELEVAVTVTRRDPSLGDHAFGVGQLPVIGTSGAFRFAVGWPAARAIRTQTSKDLPPTPVTHAGDRARLVYELKNPAGAVPTEGAPARYNVRRFIEYSDFASWQEVSKRFWPLFDAAATLKSGSPVLAEARRLAAASPDPVGRMEGALALVEDRIRYVYVGLDGGNYRPAPADETWDRRFGDCKAKTALLLALLREMKIEAEPVLVNPAGADGTDERLPSPAFFNHVLIRAHDGKGGAYWLDATRSGDRKLDLLPPPTFRWALPLSPAGEALVAVAPEPPRKPQSIDVLDIDARAGIGKPVKVTARRILRGDDIQPLRVQLANMTADDAERAVKSFWRQQADWIDADKASWKYEEAQAVLVLSVEGTGDLSWKGDEAEGRTFEIFGAGFYPPDLLRRPKDQDQGAPWRTDFPRFRCWATTIRLPQSRGKWHWAYQSPRIFVRMGGTDYFRMAGLNDGVMRTVMSRRVFLPELTAAQAIESNAQVPNFDNNMSQLYEAKGAASEADRPSHEIWTVDELMFKMIDPALIKAMEPDHSLKAVMARLDGAGVKYERAQENIDPALFPPHVREDIAKLPAGEPFILPASGGGLVGVITARKTTHEDRRPFEDTANWLAAGTPCDPH